MTATQQLSEVIAIAIANALSNLHTITIAKVTKVNTKTINCNPVINRVVNGDSVQLPEFIEVPPIILQGGPSYVALPIAVDDYCLLLVTERCFDRWYNGQDFQDPLEMRMHDYSDGFALVGVNPLTEAIQIPQETTINGIMRLGVPNPTDHMALAAKVLNELNLVKTDLTNLRTAFLAHVHPGVTAGGASTLVTTTPVTAPHNPASVASAYVKGD